MAQADAQLHVQYVGFPQRNTPVTDELGLWSVPWYQLLVELWRRLGAGRNAADSSIYGQVINNAGGAHIGFHFFHSVDGHDLAVNLYRAMLVADLPDPTLVPIGSRATVTDALGPVFLTIVANGGGDVTPVFSDGAVWRCG
jgi:hypothetical protein